jgi:hypothetical protein
VGTVLLATGADGPGNPRHDGAAERQEVVESKLKRWLVAKDAFATCEETSKAIYESLSKDFPAVMRVLGKPQEIDITNVCFRQLVLKELAAPVSQLQLYSKYGMGTASLPYMLTLSVY